MEQISPQVETIFEPKREIVKVVKDVGIATDVFRLKTFFKSRLVTRFVRKVKRLKVDSQAYSHYTVIVAE